jgi:hypothetical protein
MTIVPDGGVTDAPVSIMMDTDSVIDAAETQIACTGIIGPKIGVSVVDTLRTLRAENAELRAANGLLMAIAGPALARMIQTAKRVAEALPEATEAP